MSRWKVKSVDFETFLLWYVFEGKYSSFSGTIEWHKRRAFNSWAEAMAYVDQQARTVEVTLPRITGDMEDGMSSWPNLRGVGLSVDHHDEPRLGQPYVMIYDGYSDIGVEAYDLKPLALALLAQHYQQEHHEC